MKENKNLITQSADINLDTFIGPLPFRMTNDFLFKFLLQSSNNVLKAISAAYLELDYDSIKDIHIENPISLGKNYEDKEMILDVKATLNNNTKLNLEMQVINQHDWPERSLSYACRSFDHLNTGEPYTIVKNVIHIGFLDFTLFPDKPEFYATYMLQNIKTHSFYTRKFRISVVDLKSVDLATEEDKLLHRDLWAMFFKAKTWEDLKMLSARERFIEEATVTLAQLTEEEELRMRMEAREDRLKQELDMKLYYTREIEQRDNAIAEQASQIKDLNKQLKDQDKQLKDQDKQLKDQDKQLKDQNKQLEDQDKQLKDQNKQLKDQSERLQSLNEQILSLTTLVEKLQV